MMNVLNEPSKSGVSPSPLKSKDPNVFARNTNPSMVSPVSLDLLRQAASGTPSASMSPTATLSGFESFGASAGIEKASCSKSTWLGE